MRTIFDKLKNKYQRKRKVRSEKVFTPIPVEVEEVKEVKKTECKKCKVTEKKNVKVKKKTYGGIRK